jgi:E3 ubiquitin-protein ligase HERC2
MDERTEIDIPGATSLEITFDPASRTETNCDYLIFENAEGSSLHPSIDRITGRDGSQNWPGCEGREPLVLEGTSSCVAHFRSDGSVEDWGYKVRIHLML